MQLGNFEIISFNDLQRNCWNNWKIFFFFWCCCYFT